MRSRLTFPRLIIKLALLVALLLAAVVSLIHIQPFDDDGFQALFLADNCPSFCFMGIQPGMSTAAQAHDLLEKRGLVSEWGESRTDDPAFGQLRWRWSINRPALLTGTDGSLIYDRKTGLVSTFGEMGIRLTLGELLIVLGQPTVGFMSGGYNDRDGSIFTHAVGYPQWHLNVVSTIQCPMTLRQLWDAPLTLQLAPSADQTARFTPYPAHIQLILGYAASGFC